MIDCPPDMPIDECLKRQLASKQESSSLISMSSSKIVQSAKPLISTHAHMKVGGGGSVYVSFGSSYSAFHAQSGGLGFNMSFGKKSAAKSVTNTAIQSSSPNLNTTVSKGGIVVNKQTVIVKSNFEMAGRLNKEGKRNNAKTLGSHASASLTYMENHGARDMEQNDELSNLYNQNGEQMSKEEFDELKKELNEGVGAFRRTVIDVGHNELDRDDMNRLVRESLQEFQEQTGKQFNYTYAIHTDTDHIHAHVLSFGKSHEINMTKEHLQLFKQTVGSKTDELLQEHKLDHDRDLSLHQQIDKSMDGILDDKENQQQTHKASLSL